jgi:hypothetical protein
MHCTMLVEGVPPSDASLSIGQEVTRILSDLVGIADVEVDSQRIDGVLIGFSSACPLHLSRIYEALIARGLRPTAPKCTPDPPTGDET